VILPKENWFFFPATHDGSAFFFCFSAGHCRMHRPFFSVSACREPAHSFLDTVSGRHSPTPPRRSTFLSSYLFPTLFPQSFSVMPAGIEERLFFSWRSFPRSPPFLRKRGHVSSFLQLYPAHTCLRARSTLVPRVYTIFFPHLPYAPFLVCVPFSVFFVGFFSGLNSPAY